MQPDDTATALRALQLVGVLGEELDCLDDGCILLLPHPGEHLLLPALRRDELIGDRERGQHPQPHPVPHAEVEHRRHALSAHGRYLLHIDTESAVIEFLSTELPNEIFPCCGEALDLP